MRSCLLSRKRWGSWFRRLEDQHTLPFSYQGDFLFVLSASVVFILDMFDYVGRSFMPVMWIIISGDEGFGDLSEDGCAEITRTHFRRVG